MRVKALFIGSFLSKYKGTKGVSEILADSELNQVIDFKLISKFEINLFRLIDMVYSSLVFRGNIVHIDVYSGLAFQYADIISRIVKLRKLALIMTLHGGALPEYARSKPEKVSKVLERADYIQSPSNYLIDFFSGIGIKLQYLPNPIDLNKFPYDRSKVMPHSLLWVRAFTSIYNPDIPVYVLKDLLVSFPETKLTMVGPDRGMQIEIMQLAEDLGVSKSIDFVGPVKNEELYQYYQTHQVFLNTTSYESFGVAVVEAASCGIPIVSNSVGEIPFLWKEQEDILLVADNSIELLTNQIEKIFMNKNLGISLGKKARIKATKFDMKEVLPRWQKLLTDPASFIYYE